MQQLTVTVESSDQEMLMLKALALACGIDPTHKTKNQLIKVLMTPKSKRRMGSISRRQKAMFEAIEKRVLARSIRHEVRKDKPALKKSTDSLPAEAAREKRLAAIMSINGLWKGDPDKPQDGVAYQREARAEWR